MEKPTYEELSERIGKILSSENCTDLDVACWAGYIAALLEWRLISVTDHDRLSELLPRLDPDPTLRIFLG
ncbi:MAG: hypothetical protein JNL58_27950 [Planctomyces sp.]|nr:hypothetical protein [Planctomyces sp.]